MDHGIRHLPPPDLEVRRRLRPVLVEVPPPPPRVPEVPEPRAPGDPWEDRQIIQIWRTVTPFQPPPDDLREGELAVELATSPPRLWCGYPDALNGLGRIQLNVGDSAVGGPFLPLSGGNLTGQLVAPTITVTGQMLLMQEPITPSQAANKGYVDALTGSFVRINGSTMTGPLILSGPPTVDDGAATKLYVDDAISAGVADFLPLTGGEIYQPGGSDPLIIGADTGLDAQIIYRINNTHSWAAGALADGSFGIGDLNAALYRITIGASGDVDIPGSTIFGSAVTLSGNATANLQAVPLQQVNSLISDVLAGAFLPLTGGTLYNPAQPDWATGGRTLTIAADDNPVLYFDHRGVAASAETSGWYMVGWGGWWEWGGRLKNNTNQWVMGGGVYSGVPGTWLAGRVIVEGDPYTNDPLTVRATYDARVIFQSQNPNRRWTAGAHGGLSGGFMIADETAGAGRFYIYTNGNAEFSGRLVCADFQSNANVNVPTGWVGCRDGYYWQNPTRQYHMYNDGASIVVTDGTLRYWYNANDGMFTVNWHFNANGNISASEITTRGSLWVTGGTGQIYLNGTTMTFPNCNIHTPHRMTSGDAVIAGHHLYNNGGWLHTANLRGGAIHSDGDISGENVYARNAFWCPGGIYWHNSSGWMNSNASIQGATIHARNNVEGHDVSSRAAVIVNGCALWNNGGWLESVQPFRANSLYSHNNVEGHDVYARNHFIANGGVFAAGTCRTGSIVPYADNIHILGEWGQAWHSVTSLLWITYSDVRIKTDIQTIPETGCEKVMALCPARYHLLNETPDDPLHCGFLAQDVHSAMGDDFAGWLRGPEGHEGIIYEELTAVLWQAVRELTAEVTDLTERLEALETRR